MDYSYLISKLRAILQQSGSRKRSLQQTKYFKGVITTYGLTHPQNREIFKTFFNTYLKEFGDNDLRGLGYALLHEKGFDEKFQGIECLQRTIRTYTPSELERLGSVIDDHVFDWGTCDNLSCHVIKGILLKHADCIEVIRSWKSASSWRQRAACVSLLHFARHDQFIDVIVDICDTAIRNQYRFTQLGVGWVLRDVSVHHPELVVDFINEHENYFTLEAVRYALEKMTPLHRQMVHMIKKKKEFIV